MSTIVNRLDKEMVMAFEAGIAPKTGGRAKRAELYEFLKARPTMGFSIDQLAELTGISRSTLWSTLAQLTQVRETAEKYPHVHKVAKATFAFDPTIQRGVLPSRREFDAEQERRRRSRAKRKAADVAPVQVARGPVSESVFGLKPVKDVSVMQDGSGQRYLVTRGKGRTEIVEI
jgi:transcriptional regulator with XRE-family HTH domain